MKNLSVIFILSGIFLFSFCSNENQTSNLGKEERKREEGKESRTSKDILDSQTLDLRREEGKRGNREEGKKPQTSKKTLDLGKKEEKREKREEVKELQTSKESLNLGKEEGKVIKREEVKELQTSNSEPQTSNPKPATINPKPKTNSYNQLLQKNIDTNGKVNYQGIKNSVAELNEYLKYLDENPIQSNWSKAKKMAYWINVYNAFTIKMIVDNYPVASITKLHGGKPWDVKWIKLNGKTYNLNNIENDILRPQYKDARIHFAVNCAAKSCPPILNKAWMESNLERLLEQQTKAFINNPKFNTIKKNEIEISKIFEWYAADFGNIVDFLNKYSTIKIDKNAKVTFKEYDWNLNE